MTLRHSVLTCQMFLQTSNFNSKCRGLEHELQECKYYSNGIQNGLNLQKFTGIYSPYQYEIIQIHLDID